jgi:hypothetical protein
MESPVYLIAGRRAERHHGSINVSDNADLSFGSYHDHECRKDIDGRRNTVLTLLGLILSRRFGLGSTGL